MNRTIGTAAAADGLVMAADFSGFVHCLDASTGERLWVHDVESGILGSPLICDGKVYVGDESGNVTILSLAREKRVLAAREFPRMIWAAPVFANGVLYVATANTLYAIGGGAGDDAGRGVPAAVGGWSQYRGPGRTNVAPDTGLLDRWPADGPPLVWKTAGVGEGVPPVAVADGRVFTLGSARRATGRRRSGRPTASSSGRRASGRR